MLTFTEVRKAIVDPAIQSRWLVVMPDQDYPFQCFAESVEAVQKGVGSKARQAQGKVKYFAETSEIDTLNIVFYETHKFTVTKYLEKWRGLIYSDGTYGAPKGANGYEKIIYVHFLSQDSERIEQTFEYVEAWPTAPAPITLSYEDPNARIQINSQFRVGDVKIY